MQLQTLWIMRDVSTIAGLGDLPPIKIWTLSPKRTRCYWLENLESRLSDWIRWQNFGL